MATMADAQVGVTVRAQERTGPRVAVAVLLRDDAGRILWELRRGIGEGLWSIPGGKVEGDEEPIEAARRELREETSVEGFDFAQHPGGWIWTPPGTDGIPWVTLYFTARWARGMPQPRVMEGTKCARLEWLYEDELPSPLFAPVQRFLFAGHDPWGGFPR